MQRMTLIERLLNPPYVTNPNGGDAILDTQQAVAIMREAAIKLAKPDRTDGKYAEARRLHGEGLTYRQIARKLGWKSICSVHAAIKG